MHLETVAVLSEDGLTHNGLLYNAGSGFTVLHVHGKCGSYYENAFVAILAEVYASAGYNLMAVNNRGTGCIVEAYRHGVLEYIGGSVEAFEGCLADIGGATKYLSERGHRVVLQGHSAGCEKIALYCSERGGVEGVILLSPGDSYALQSRYIFPETLPAQLVRLRGEDRGDSVGDPLELAAPREYGVATVEKCYRIPIVRTALITWLDSPYIKMFHEKEWWQTVDVPAFAYVGAKDDLQVAGVSAMERCLRSRFSHLAFCSPTYGDHHLSKAEVEVGTSVVDWLRGLDL